jgi:hypothetical protein
MIASYIDGRIRLRARALTNPQTLLGLARMIESRPGVRRISTNARTGSLLLEYEPDVLSRAALLAAVTVLEASCGGEDAEDSPAGQRKTIRSARTRRAELRLLGLSAGLCASSLLFSRRLHAGAGLAFLLLAARHTFQYRDRLI